MVILCENLIRQLAVRHSNYLTSRIFNKNYKFSSPFSLTLFLIFSTPSLSLSHSFSPSPSQIQFDVRIVKWMSMEVDTHYFRGYFHLCRFLQCIKCAFLWAWICMRVRVDSISCNCLKWKRKQILASRVHLLKSIMCQDAIFSFISNVLMIWNRILVAAAANETVFLILSHFCRKVWVSSWVQRY